MKKFVLWTLYAVIAIVGGGFLFLLMKGPAKAAPGNIKVEATAERLQRGKYLFEHLADCAGCHSPRNVEKFGMMIVPEGVGSGFEFPKEIGLPGTVIAPNLTPDPETGLGKWTDGEKIRAIREGVSRDGRALFPLMPYQAFSRMSDEDVYSVVAYMNSLPPVKRPLARTELDFPVNLMIKFAPQPVSASVGPPDRTNRLKYGEYLVTIGGCIGCHSKEEKGTVVPGSEYGGGREFNVSTYLVRSANISPDEETGIGKWSEDRFISKFRGYSNVTYENASRTNQSNFTLMPWAPFSQLTDDDLRAIYAYLRTVKPVQNSVDVHPPAPQPQT